jgi:hypothetical protein
MKRWSWMLVLPWAVVVSTGHKNSIESEDRACAVIYNGDRSKPLITFFGAYVTQGWCEGMQDLVEAMNEAHQRRTQTKSPLQERAEYRDKR